MNNSAERAPRAGSGEMFDQIAKRYDVLNRIMSLGLDRGWRKKAVGSLALPKNARVLDLATGTADLAMQIATTHPDAKVIGLDPSRGMLAEGERKIAGVGLQDRVTLQVGDAQELPFEDASFDGISIAFGIRNVPDRERALREMARVLKPAGRVAILELSEPRGGVMGALARTYVHEVVPRMGALLSGAQEYRYLQRSIEAFPPAGEFAKTMERSGLLVLSMPALSFGVAHLYVATKARAKASVEAD